MHRVSPFVLLHWGQLGKLSLLMIMVIVMYHEMKQYGFLEFLGGNNGSKHTMRVFFFGLRFNGNRICFPSSFKTT